MPGASSDVKSVFARTLAAAAAVLLVYAFVKVINLLFLTFLALLLSIFMDFFIDFFALRVKLPRGVGLLLTLAILLSVLIVLALTIVPVVIDQGQRALEQLPSLAVKLQHTINSFLARVRSNLYVEVDELITEGLKRGGTAISKGLFAAVGKGFYLAMEIFALVVVAIYFSLTKLDDPTPLTRLFPPQKRERVAYLYLTALKKLRAWLMGQLFSMTVIAVLYMIGLTIIGVPYAVFFGILAGILCFVPYIGPPTSTIGPLLFALAESPMKALWVLVLYAASQTVESYFLTPMVMRHQVKLHPIVTIISIMAMGQLFGVLGVAIAVPTVAVGQFMFEELVLKRQDVSMEV